MSNIYELQTLMNAHNFTLKWYNNTAYNLDTKYEKKFDMDWTLFKGEQPTADQLDLFHLYVVNFSRISMKKKTILFCFIFVENLLSA